MPSREIPDAPDFGAFFNASPHAYVLLDRELTIVKVNGAYLEAVGRERDELLGEYVFDAFPGDPGVGEDGFDGASKEDSNRRRLEEAYEEVISTGTEVSIAFMPYVIPHETDGGRRYEKRYWSVTLSPILDEEGAVAFIVHHPTDVTDLYEQGHFDESVSEEEATDGESGPAVDDETSGGGVPSQQVEGGVYRRAKAVQNAFWKKEEERKRLQRLFDQAPGFMTFLRGPDHVFEMANESFFQLVGHRNIIGKPIREALPEVVDQGFLELLDRVYDSGEPFVGKEVEVRLVRDDSGELETVYVDFVYQPITGPDGDVVGIFTQGHDVTEKKEAKDRLRQRTAELEALNESLEEQVQTASWERERLRTLLDSIPDDVWFCDGNGHISLLNEAATQESGLELDEVVGRPLEEVLLEVDIYESDGTPRPPGEAPLFRSLDGEVVEGEEELLFCPEIGEKRHRLINSAPIRGASGEITGSVAVVRDVTELKRTEEKLRKRERDFTALANNIPQLTWMADPDGSIFWYNERWYEYTGTTLDEMKGWGWKKVHHPDHVDRVVRQYKEALETEEPFEDTFPLRGEDGEYRWFLTRAMPVRNEEGQVVRWFGTNTDVTNRLRLEDKLKEINETLEERVEKRTRQVRELTSKVTMAEQRERERIGNRLYEDLQQRLYGSQLKVRSLRSSLQNNGQDELAREAEAAVEGLKDVIQAMRQISVGMSPPVLEREGLSAALEWLRSHVEETRGLDVHLSAEREFRMEKEMRILLFQVVRELLSNVAEHAGVGRADVVLREENGALFIQIIDQGEGFDPDTLESLDPEEGFGLTAARERLHLYGGDLTVRSAPREGTRVTVCFPLESSLETLSALGAGSSVEKDSPRKEEADDQRSTGERQTQTDAK